MSLAVSTLSIHLRLRGPSREEIEVRTLHLPTISQVATPQSCRNLTLQRCKSECRLRVRVGLTNGIYSAILYFRFAFSQAPRSRFGNVRQMALPKSWIRPGFFLANKPDRRSTSHFVYPSVWAFPIVIAVQSFRV